MLLRLGYGGVEHIDDVDVYYLVEIGYPAAAIAIRQMGH